MDRKLIRPSKVVHELKNTHRARVLFILHRNAVQLEKLPRDKAMLASSQRKHNKDRRNNKRHTAVMILTTKYLYEHV